MNNIIKKHIEHLGGELKSTQGTESLLGHVKWYCPGTKKYWTVEDPKGQLKDISRTIQNFCSIQWPEKD